MKKLFVFGLIAAVLPALAEEAADRKTATSLKYVTHELDTRQDKFTAETNKAMEYTNSAGAVEKRTVKSDLGSDTTDTSLPMVGGVNTKLNQKQDDIDPVNDHTAVTYTGTAGGIGQKGIYQATESYAAQSDNLIDAKTFNAALKNGLDSEFVCREDNRDPVSNLCWLYTIHNGTVGNTLPDGYTELEYIKSDGTQYMRIPYRVNNKTQLYVKYNVWQNGNEVASAVFGVTDTPSPNTANNGVLRLVDGTTSNFNRVGWGNTTTGSIIDISNFKSLNTWYEAFYDQNKMHLNGTLVATSSTPNTTVWTANYDLGLFARTSSSVTMKAKAKISNAWAKEDGVLKFNLIPAKHGNDVGMYDTVSQTFLKSAVDGTNFEAGPEVTINVYIPQNQ